MADDNEPLERVEMHVNGGAFEYDVYPTAQEAERCAVVREQTLQRIADCASQLLYTRMRTRLFD